MMTQKLSLILSSILGFAVLTGSSASAQDILLLQHAAQLRAQVDVFHQSATHQLRFSPYKGRICRLSGELQELACSLEEELLDACSCDRAEWIVSRIERKRDNLARVLHTAVHRANVGIDPRVGCLDSLERQFLQIDRIVECMHESVHVYRPLTRRSSFQRGSLQGHGQIRRSGSCGNSLNRGSGHYDDFNRAQFHGNGFTIQRGSFRISF